MACYSFGLTGAPATFQRYINWVLREYLDDFCTAYIDDILIFSNGTLDDHRTKVRLVLARLADSGLTLDIKKCDFEAKSVKYLGYIIDVGAGLRMDPEKVQAITNWLAPTTVKGVRGFLGFANYYRMFINDYSEITRPLTQLTRKDAPFLWTTDCQHAFDLLKERFIADPILATFDPDRETYVKPDASNWATGGVLSQVDDAGNRRPVAFHSRKNLPAECNYDIHDKELLAVIRCLQEWDAELRSLNQPFTVLTDHKNLETFMKAKRLNERQMRWMDILSCHDFVLKYRPGSDAIIPDALSRRDQDRPQGYDDDRLAERVCTLLPPSLWAAPAHIIGHTGAGGRDDCNDGNDQNDDRSDNSDDPNSTVCENDHNLESPFEDDKLTNLWNQAVTADVDTLVLMRQCAIPFDASRRPLD